MRALKPQSKPRNPAAFFATAERRVSDFAASGIAFARRSLADLPDPRNLSDALSPHKLQARFRHLQSRARAATLPYSSDEREALALLFLPFLLVASAVVVHQSVRTLHSYISVVSAPELEIAPVRPDATAGLPFSALPRSVAREVQLSPTALLAPVAGSAFVREIQDAGLALNTAPLGQEALALGAPEPLGAPSTTESELASVPATAAEQTTAPVTTLALMLPPVPAREMGGPERSAAPPLLESYEADSNGNPIFAGICSADQAASLATAVAAPANDHMTLTADAFGLRLAAAAESQVGKLVIYNDAYRSISYPMGDVPSLFGVCTDVIVRAYRAIGLDLQTLVHEARSGRGDANIDHRRTEILRKFFATHGESLPITSFPEDYRPGDIVTYHRPQNRGARAHIAMVSSVMAPSGRLMIVHNRGWGPQLEDALFVDQVTGHYRYRGPAAIRNAAHDEGQSGQSKAAHRAAGPAGLLMPASHVVPAALKIDGPETAPATGRH
ncbi:DUF1287 domain-containing protein [Hyphomicrobium sp. LHD-15]|uniref:DUF1287 domain-containing protein n=1 Tax=Hyphomicrobium sp. LHD-15 TaxID=3072142 RepID=UPI00280FA98A|nr:DUF1287 domain-containing protein [Hyphomicrobium sp. LHD-15]MDQ8698916.1 DUF1287 domain-containing protein [Hyphomicrobium sp. LHD-15]